jgi:hypothetical protein
LDLEEDWIPIAQQLEDEEAAARAAAGPMPAMSQYDAVAKCRRTDQTAQVHLLVQVIFSFFNFFVA